MQTKFIKLEPAQAKDLAHLARTIYRENYLYLWKPGGAEWYMHHHAYREDLLAAEIRADHCATYFLLENSLPVGYLKLVWQEPISAKNGILEIERIYLSEAAKGRGYGRKLMEFAETQASLTGIQTLRLKAMDSSLDAIRFYTHLGYKQIGKYYLCFPLMLPAYRGMVILEKQIDKKNPPASGGKPGF
ncbi:MAG TPA: GNAT family N-acetyltransferase [Sediminibacterium sp.]|nr:GNAT family N-acetyltransferase [Sediminibacterium sp.]